MPETVEVTPTIAEIVKTAEPPAELYGVYKYTVALSQNSPDAVEGAIGLAYTEAAHVGELNRLEQRDLVRQAEIASEASNRLALFKSMLEMAPHLERNETFSARALVAAKANSDAEWLLLLQSERAGEVRQHLHATHVQTDQVVKIVLERERLGKLFRKVAFGAGVLSAATVFLLGVHRESGGLAMLRHDHVSQESVLNAQHEYTDDNVASTVLIGSLMWLGAARLERKKEHRLVNLRAGWTVRAARRRYERQQQREASQDENGNDIAP